MSHLLRPWVWTALLALACRNKAPQDGIYWEGGWSSASVYTSPANPLAAIVEIESSRDAEVALAWDCGHRAGTSQAAITADGEATLEVWGVRPRTGCALTLTLTDSQGRVERSPPLAWTSGAPPKDTPSFTSTGTSPPALTILSPVPYIGEETTVAYAYGVDEEGEVVWLYIVGGGSTQDHIVHDAKDSTFYVHFPGRVRRISPAGRTLSEIGSSDTGDTHHDMLALPGGDAVVMAREIREVNAPVLGGTVNALGDRLVRLNAENEIVWEWSAFDHLDTTRFPGNISRNFIESDEAYDWTHGNGLGLTPDGQSILYSTRAQSWVVQISLNTGEVEWILGEDGDFTLTSGEWFYSQHAPDLQADGTLTVYDNGNDRPEGRPTSRAVRYQLDTANMTATQIWSYDTGTFTTRLGDANPLPDGAVLVTVGSPRDGDARVVEVAEDGTERWRVDVDGTDLFGAERVAWPE